MKIININPKIVAAAAKEAFPEYSIQMESGALFIPECADGAYDCDVMTDTLYVSTSIGYYEQMIKGNQTRVKAEIMLIFLKKSPYEVIYEGKKRCYAAMEEDEGKITFLPYEEFLQWIKRQIHKREEA